MRIAAGLDGNGLIANGSKSELVAAEQPGASIADDKIVRRRVDREGVAAEKAGCAGKIGFDIAIAVSDHHQQIIGGTAERITGDYRDRQRRGYWILDE